LHEIRRNDIRKAERVIVDFYQFTSVNELTGAGNRNGKYHETIMLFAGEHIGNKYTQNKTLNFSFDLIKKKVEPSFWIQMDIIHPHIDPTKGCIILK